MLSGLSIRHASSRFRLGRMSLQRHSVNCIAGLVALAESARQSARQREAVALVQSLPAYEGSLMLVAQEARGKGQFGPAVNGLARAAQIRALRESRPQPVEAGPVVEGAPQVLEIRGGFDIDLEALEKIPAAPGDTVPVSEVIDVEPATALTLVEPPSPAQEDFTL